MEKIAFLVHPRHSLKEDMARVCWLFGWLPEWLLGILGLLMPPIAAGKIKMHGCQEVSGIILVVPLSGKQFLRGLEKIPKNASLRWVRKIYRNFYQKLVFWKVLQAGKKAERMGAKMLGLGQFTSVATCGGKKLTKTLRIGITNGNALTAAVTVRAFQSIITKRQLRDPLVAVVGASGSVGSAVSRMLSAEGVRLLLVARDIDKLQRFAAECPGAEVSIDMDEVKRADVVVVTTSSTEYLIHPHHLKYGAVVYDDTQPQNTHPDLTKIRPDVVRVDGAIIETNQFKCNLDIGLRSPEGWWQLYACLADTMIRGLAHKTDDHIVGNPTLAQCKEILSLFDQVGETYGFRLAPFSSFGAPLNGALAARKEVEAAA